MMRRNLVQRTAAILLAVAAIVSLPISTASAELLVIEFTGLEIEYDGTDIFDVGKKPGHNGDPAESDSLTSMTFTLGANPADVLTTDIFADILIPGVPLIPTDGSPISTVAGGFFDLLTSTTVPGFGLELDVQFFEVTYTGFAINIFGHGVATEVSQDLPFGLMILPGDEVSISFSTQIDMIEFDNDDVPEFVTHFISRGTGEVRAENVPEPSTLVLSLLGCLAVMFTAFASRCGRSR